MNPVTKQAFAAGGATFAILGALVAELGPEAGLVAIVLVLMLGSTALVVLEEVEYAAFRRNSRHSEKR